MRRTLRFRPPPTAEASPKKFEADELHQECGMFEEGGRGDEGEGGRGDEGVTEEWRRGEEGVAEAGGRGDEGAGEEGRRGDEGVAEAGRRGEEGVAEEGGRRDEGVAEGAGRGEEGVHIAEAEAYEAVSAFSDPRGHGQVEPEAENVVEALVAPCADHVFKEPDFRAGQVAPYSADGPVAPDSVAGVMTQDSVDGLLVPDSIEGLVALDSVEDPQFVLDSLSADGEEEDAVAQRVAAFIDESSRQCAQTQAEMLKILLPSFY